MACAGVGGAFCAWTVIASSPAMKIAVLIMMHLSVRSGWRAAVRVSILLGRTTGFMWPTRRMYSLSRRRGNLLAWPARTREKADRPECDDLLTSSGPIDRG